MDTRLNQLENNEAVLLMYIADELSLEDKAEVAQMIENDASISRQWSDIRRAYDASGEAIRSADAAAKIPSAFAAARAFGEAVRQKNANRPAPEVAEVYVRGHHRWLLYPVAAAAVLAMGMLAWFQSANNEVDERYSYVEWNSDPYRSVARQELAVMDPLDFVDPSPAQYELQMLSFLREDTLR
ncbi:MAG TPA: hypothetical protein VGB55_06450 [Tepidisphaeraceae bacterium]|jgi:hypothetical protein